MPALTRITHDPNVMGGKPCIRGLRVTVGTIVGLVAAGRSHEEILRLYPYLEGDDIREALSYAAWRVENPAAMQEGAKYLQHEASLGSRTDFERVLAKVPTVPPEPYDALE